MKRMMVMVAVALASVMAFSATVEFLGVEVGGTLNVQDAKVREKVGVGKPVSIVLASGFKYWQCDSTAPKCGYDEFGVMVSTNKAVLGVSASVNCPDEKTAEEKKGKIIAEFKAKYADRLSPDGGYALTVATGSDSATGKAYVEVDLETTAFKAAVARNNNPAK